MSAMVAQWMAQQAQRETLAEEGVRYAWVLTHDQSEDPADPDAPLVELPPGDRQAGPADVTDEELAKALEDGQPFRLRDDDGYLCGQGVFWTSDQPEHWWNSVACMVPLDDFGMGHYGATDLQHLNNEGQWRSL